MTRIVSPASGTARRPPQAARSSHPSLSSLPSKKEVSPKQKKPKTQRSTLSIPISPGDLVEVVTDTLRKKGTVMPNETEHLVIKLDSGYNIGIDRHKIRSIKIVEKYRSTAANTPVTKGSDNKKKDGATKNKNLKNVALLHTGGTIASKVDYRTGGVVARFDPKEILELFPELKNIVAIDSRLIGNMWSEDMRFVHFQKIAQEIVKELKRGAQGIIVTHGTDFMAYTAAALAFMLQDIPVPVILVGAQRSSDRGSSDAAMNLICAAEFIAQTTFAGVALCMHETQNDVNCLILPATTTRKMHASRRDAFHAINTHAIARINYETKIITWLNDKEQKTESSEEKKNTKTFKAMIKMEEKVALIKTHPNMVPAQFKAFKGFKGLVIEGSGLGHAPTGVPDKDCTIHAKNLAEIKKLIKSGTVILMTTQTIYGAVQMHVYSKGIDLVAEGIIPCKSLPETALIKLAWLLANYPREMQNREKARTLVETNFCGEMFYRIEDHEFLN